MLLLFGFKTVHKSMPGRTASCRNCGAFSHHLLEEQATKFTLFFLPVLLAVILGPAAIQAMARL